MMRIGYGARFATLIIFAATVLTAAGCGYKTDPVPPVSVVPVAIDDLRYTIDQKGVLLSWTYPVKTIKGTDAVDIASFDIYRAVVPLTELCESCPIPFGAPIEVPGGESSEMGKPKVAEYRTSLLRSGHKYFFKIRSRQSWWAQSADSNIISFVWHVPSSAPTGVKAAADDGRITLTWNPVTTLIDGREADSAVTYQVLRSEGGKEFQAYGGPLSTNRLVDTKVFKGLKYFYKVQSVLAFKGYNINGAVSDVASAAPVDRTPPRIPSGVNVVETASGIKVLWDPANDSDITGFRIYRRSAEQKTPVRIGEVSKISTIFVDKNVPEDIRMYYSVSAIDEADPPNESDRSREATVR